MSPLRILVLCAGEQARWDARLDVPKYMVPIDGIPLYLHTHNLLSELGCTDIQFLIKHGSPKLSGVNVTPIRPDITGDLADKFLSSRDFWLTSGHTILLFGDVWLSPSAAQELFVTQGNTIRFIGRLLPSNYTGCQWEEIFALSFGHDTHDILLHELESLTPKLNRPAGWLLYDELLRKCSVETQPQLVFSHINDFSEDFDSPGDYETWCKNKTRVKPVFHDAIAPNAKTKKASKNELKNTIKGVAWGVIITCIYVLIHEIVWG
ncbi:MAG: hypothetical protein V3V13_00590 [Paracoccaceae bacterium]